MDTPNATDNDAWSIANHPPTRIAEPSLLHLLVQSRSQLGVPAIDFLAHDGVRVALSYADFHRAADALAGRISALAGSRIGSEPFVVPVLVPQSPELYIALLAILKAGGAFCPMNLDVPLERARFILEDVSAAVVVTTSSLASMLPQGEHAVLIIDEETPCESRVVAEQRHPRPHDLAYVMYTSGSTGTPKGVGISHDAATQSLLAHDRRIPPFSRFLQFAAPTFDVSVFEIFFPLFRGVTLVSCARPAMLNDLPAVITEMDVDACELTPTVAGSLLRRRESAPSLRLLLTIGEMLTGPVVEEFGGGGDDERPSMLWGMYGPTEAAIHCTVQPAFASDSAVRNIGVPLDTVSAFILKIPEDGEADREVQVLPRGQVGELAVGGYQLADGYLNRPEQTRSAFVDTLYGRLYRTGDKAMMRPDGSLECLGRIADGQVKLRGQRIELGEIEHAALRTRGCHGAVAAVADATLVLFCAVDEGGDMVSAIRESCKRWLPGFMLPADIVVVESFPRLASGKVDRKKLLADYKESLQLEMSRGLDYRDDLEKQLCDLAREALGVEVRPDQDLARAGMDSLGAIKFASVLGRAAFSVGAVDVLDARTITGLRTRLTTVDGDSAREPLVASKMDVADPTDIVAKHPLLLKDAERIEAVIPCTPLQASMLAETMVEPRAYCNWVELRFPESIPAGTIRFWFLQLAKMNEILRTGFIHHDGRFLQLIFRELGEASISTPARPVRGFGMSEDRELLSPFRIQISPAPGSRDSIVIMQLHHAVYDGWSLDLMLSDLATLAQGAQPEGRPQFREVSSYYQSKSFTDSCDAAREFWASNLQGFQPPQFPMLHQQAVAESQVISSAVSLNIQPQDLKRALQLIGCGAPTVFQAAVAWLWSSMIGCEDVVVGSVTSGRTIPGCRIEDVVGPCIAALPLRTHLGQMRTVRDLLLSVQAGNRAALSQGVLPLSEIKRVAGMRAGQAVYDVLFIYQEALQGRRTTNAFREIGHQDYLETKLLIEVEPRAVDFSCRFTYHCDAIPRVQIDILQKSLRVLVSHILADFNSEISSLRKAFPSHLLSVYNPNPASFSGVPDLAAAVERVAAECPEKDAVCFANHISEGVIQTTTVSFAELNSEANRIAWHLRLQGLNAGGVVAIITEKSIRLYAGILAILKSGCAYLPLLPSTPVARVQTILQQAGVSVCLVDRDTHGLLKGLPCNFVDIQSLDMRSAPPHDPDRAPDPNQLAYVIYTSGSTGLPKGVCLTQLNITSNLDVLSHIYPVKESSRLLQSCSQAFDVSVFEIFFAWTQGLCLCSGTNDTLFEDLERSIRKLNVTHLSMTPTVASLVDPAKVPLVEFLVTAGEGMTETVALRWGEKLYQGYGPSETTNICSVKKMRPGDTIQHLGWSFRNTSTFVLAQDGIEPVPLGCLGELCFGGDQVAQGYLGMPDLTSAKFITHPAFGRLYRSGDLGRMHPDGSMLIVGRVDDQIKIRGQRVELREITETMRRAVEAVDFATLFLKGEDPGAQDRIVAYWVPRGYEAPQFQVLDLCDELEAGIRTLYLALNAQLPAYMVPSAIIPISTLPTTASGKLDRGRLKNAFDNIEQHYLALVSHGAELAPDDGEWSDTELQVAEVVADIFKARRSEIRRWTPLTSLGLDSISAIRVSRRLEEQLGKRLPISHILRNANVARLAQALHKEDAAVPSTRLAELVPKHLVDKVVEGLGRLPFDKILPCTPLQEAMLATSAGKGRYLNRMLFRVNGDLERLRKSWEALCARHGILRTCFVSTADAQRPILQVVLSRWQPPWYDLDASRSTVDDCISQQVLAAPDPLDAMEPAVSFASIKHAGHVYLSFICHHALYDGVAIERLLYEIEQHFSASPLPLAPEYERFLRESLVLPPSTNEFWLKRLAGYEPKLITDLRSAGPEASGMLTREFAIPLFPIKTKVRALGVSLLALIQSAWATALGCLFRTTDVCFGNVVSGRSLPVDGIDSLIAPCFNTIPVRVALSSSQRNVDLMKVLQTLNAELMPYQFTPLRRIHSLLSQQGTRRLFDTLLLLQPSPRPLDRSLWTLERDEGEMDVPLVCEATPVTETDRFVVKMYPAKTHQLSHGIVELMLDLFIHALRNCLEFPASSISLEDIPQGLADRVSEIPFLLPSAPMITHQSDTASESWTATESDIRAVLAALLSSNSERIRRHTTIYQLGLDSISAVQIASMLRERGYQVAASDVIEHPACESLARYIDTRAPKSDSKPAFDLVGFEAFVRPQIIARGLPADRIEAILPCTPVQSAMMAQFVKSGGRDYLNHVVFELQDGVSTAQLLEAWRVVAALHPLLRTALLPVEHGCAFAMIQYCPTDAVPVELTEVLDSEQWRLEVASEAAEVPGRMLWKVAIAEGRERSSMHLAIHHAVYDAYSLQRILGDLATALRGGQLPPPIPTEAAVLDILGQATAETEGSAEFWKQQAEKLVINGFPVMTPLRQTSREILTVATVSSTSLTVLEEAAAKAGFTLQVILQAAWTRVLSAYLGEGSVVFGVVLSGRNTEATRNAAFPCITTLPVLSSNSDSNRTLLTEMLQYNAGLYKQQHQPLTRIQQWLGCPGGRLFDTLLVYQKFDAEAPRASPWRIVDEIANVDHPVSVEVEPKPDNGLGYRITFFSDVLAKEQARMLLQQFDEIVRHLAFEPDGHESDLPTSCPDLFSILPPEIPEIPTTVKYLHQFVEVQAVKTPDATALHFVETFDNGVPVGRTWTYRQLDDNGNRVAHILLPHARPGDIVAVYFEKCPEAYFSILGILKAGCAFVALDPSAPRERNEFILADSKAMAILTSSQGKASMLLSVSMPVVCIGEASLASAPSSIPILRRDVRPDDVCYCLYTSGTTGTPKGCEITHDNAVQCMLAFQHIFRGHWQEDSKWLQFASLHFDVSVLEQYWSWSVGITLVAAPRDLILDDLAAAISRLGITHIDLTPSLARLLHPDDVPSLCRGVFITGGESLKQEILDVWGSKGVIYNFYGPTEATIGVTVYPRVPATGRPSNIGKQFINVGAYVLKLGTEQAVLRGGVGELCVSGRLVGKGYLRREDLKAERFPTLQRYGERVYRTGDLVRVLHDGCFDFLGRADDQVKLRGQRLEIGEINHVIRTGVEAVTDVATLVVRDEAQHKDLLVSFIVARNVRKRGPADPLELVEGPEALELCRRARDACRSKLPGYMVPTYVLQLPFIPLSANNKAEIKELRRFFSSLGRDRLMSVTWSSAKKVRRALDSKGASIARALATMLSVDANEVSAESNIFELGIDSISVLRFCRALKDEGLTEATPSLVLQHPLIGDLAAALEANTASSNSDAVAAARQFVQACAHKHRPHVCRELGITQDQIEYIAPCSPLQQGMISRSLDDGAYFNTFRLMLASQAPTGLVREAWQRTVDALPILRTKFVGTVDGFVQVALRKSALSSYWREMKLSETSVEDAVLKTREAWMARNRGCLTQPLEVVLVHYGRDVNQGDRLLLLNIFHALYDANSLALVLDQVAAEYLALAGGYTRPTASVPSFLDALCHGPLQDFSRSRPFWEKHLDGADLGPAVISSRDAASKVTTSIQRRVSFGALEALRISLGVTHQTLVQTAWVTVLAKRLSADPTIGIIVSGRAIELDGAERIVGPLFNTLPFHARYFVPEDGKVTTWSFLIRQCHEFNTAVLAFQHTPLRDIQRWCSAGKPLFDTLFSFQRDGPTMVDGPRFWTEVYSELNVDYPLALEARVDPDNCLHLLLVAQAESHSSDQLLAVMDELEASLSSMTQNPDSAVFHQEPQVVDETDIDKAPTKQLASVETIAPTFRWTREALLIHQEMAALASVEPESVSETTPLFGLGLDSIDIIKLSARLKLRGIELRASELMKAQTLAAMWRILDSRPYNAQLPDDRIPTPHVAEILAGLSSYVAELGELSDSEIVLPTTPLQESMVAEMVESDFLLYFNHDIRELAPSVDLGRLKDAWKTVVAGTPILRTRFVPIDVPVSKSTYCQVIGPNTTPHMIDIELRSMDELASVCDMATQRAREAAGRSHLVQLAFASVGGRRFLVLSLAHALYDGWSLPLIHRDVHDAYEGAYMPRSMDDYLACLEDVLFPPQQDASSFWRGFLEGATPTVFPEEGDQEDSSEEDTNGDHKVEMASSVSPDEAASFCREHAVTLQTLGQACWAAVLASRTGSLDVTFGVVLACRDARLQDLVFPTMNTVAVRSVLHGTISSWLRYMQDNMASIAEHQHFPLREAHRVSQTRGPLFNTLFISQRKVRFPRQQDWELLVKPVGGSSAVEYPVCVEMAATGSGPVWRAAVSGAYGSRDDALGLLRAAESVLAHLVRWPDASVLAFNGLEVSICGLEPIPLGNPGSASAVDSPKTATDGSDSWSAVEESIRDVLAEVSGVPAESILRSNNIYHLGLDSISVVKAGSLLRKKGIDMRFRGLLKAKSIADMARLVCDAQALLTPEESESSTDAASPLVNIDVPAVLVGAGIDESAVKEVFPASPMQVHMLSVWQNTDGEVFYPWFTYNLVGELERCAITAAWNAVVAEMPILRTVFVSTGDRSMPILQVVVYYSALMSPSSSGTAEPSNETAGLMVHPYHHFVAEEHGPGRWRIRLKIHHALYDAVSLPTIMDRFASLCANAAQETASAVFDWRSVLTPHFSRENQAARQAFWTGYLAGADSTPLRFDNCDAPDPNRTGPRTGVVKRAAVQGVSGLAKLCRDKGVSLQALFFSAYAQVLASSTVGPRPTCVVFGVYLANRAEVSDPGATSYPFLRLVPLRVALAEDSDLVDVAVVIQRDIHAVSSPVNVEVGLWEIKDWTGITVESFVNFLGVPVPREDGVDRAVLLEQVAMPDVGTAEEHHRGARKEHGPAQELLSSNPVRDAYADAVDIEVSVEGDDMTIGVFGPRGLGVDRGMEVIDSLVSVLRRAA